jgi:hypothetical protein
MTPTQMFYENNVFVEEVDFSPIIDETSTPLQRDTVAIRGPLLRLAAVAVVGTLTLSIPGVSSWTLPRNVPIEWSDDSVPIVGVPNAHAQAASRFNRMFRPVPLSAVEKLPDPDYGL